MPSACCRHDITDTTFSLSLYYAQILLAAKGFLRLMRVAVDADIVRWQLAPFYVQPRWASSGVALVWQNLCRLYVGTFILFSIVLGL
jgi:hypothetical protein